jgi:hypothetical protein
MVISSSVGPLLFWVAHRSMDGGANSSDGWGGFGFIPERYYKLPPWHDIELTFVVVGEQRIWNYTMGASGVDSYRVILRPSVMEKMKERLSRSGVWGSKEGGREEWRVKVRFCNRTCSLFDGNPPRRYDTCEFDAVVILYDPRPPRKTFELVWTKVCPGLVLRHNCSKMIGH